MPALLFLISSSVTTTASMSACFDRIALSGQCRQPLVRCACEAWSGPWRLPVRQIEDASRLVHLADSTYQSSQRTILDPLAEATAYYLRSGALGVATGGF
jgi:hypothetical protein